jgi:hypothetical protein
MSKIKELVMRLEEADLPIENESVELLNARDRLIDVVEQEKAQREWEIEKALKEASRIQLENELKERNENGLFKKHTNTASNIPVEYQQAYYNDEL